MLAALESTIETAPVELAFKVDAFVEFAAAIVMPLVPAVRSIVAALSAPAVVIPLPAWLAFNTKDVPELAFRVIPAALVSTMLTAPVEFAVSVPAFVEPVPLIAMPPVPAVIESDALLSVLVVETVPAPPGVAVNVMDVAAVSPAVNVTLPAVELSAMLLAFKLAPTEAVLIVLAAVMLT